MTTTADAENKFLEDMPGEIKEVLKWYADARSTVAAGHNMADFAGRFLGAMHEDGAVLQLWLLYGFAIRSAGREDQALSIMNDAYDAYVRAGKPEELRESFADVQSPIQRRCRQRMA